MIPTDGGPGVNQKEGRERGKAVDWSMGGSRGGLGVCGGGLCGEGSGCTGEGYRAGTDGLIVRTP